MRSWIARPAFARASRTVQAGNSDRSNDRYRSGSGEARRPSWSAGHRSPSAGLGPASCRPKTVQADMAPWV
jgi:hypothetical protein